MEKESLDSLTKEYKSQKAKLKELKENELMKVAGGSSPFDVPAGENAGDGYSETGYCNRMASCAYKCKAECPDAAAVSNCRFG